MDSLEKLNATSLPPHTSFYSHLKGTNISTEDYTFCQDIWESHHMTTFKDFLIWYNNMDVKPFLQAIHNMFTFYRERGVDPFKDAVSLPGITMRYLFSRLPPDTTFSLISE